MDDVEIMKINYNFYHWGPFLYKTKLTNEEINKIKKLCKKNIKKNFRSNLAGLIKNEYEINSKKLFSIIFLYLDSYSKAAQEHYNINIGKKITLKESWVNFMTKFESNPLHSHSGDLSFIIYLDIPKKLKEECNDTISNKSKPGGISFVNKLNDEKLFINSLNFFPEIGDFFIFPASLNHYVNHFQSEGERVSVSGNIELEDYEE